MITQASVMYCEQCKCRTLHLPLPSGGVTCEWHPQGADGHPGQLVIEEYSDAAATAHEQGDGG